MNTYKGFIFDFNGVLLIDQHLHDQVFTQTAKEIMGRIPTEEEFLDHIHGRTNELIFEFFHGRKLNSEELNAAAKKKELAYQELSRKEGDKYHLAEGAAELLDELKIKNIPHTIATSSPTMNIAFFDEMLQLSNWFELEKIVCDDGTIRGKPAPDLYLKGAETLNLSPSDCVVIEDARSGIASAHAAGIGYIIAIGPKEKHEALSSLPGVSECVEKLSDVDVETLFG